MRSDFLNRLPFAPVVGAMFGIVAGLLVMATPHWLFEQAVAGSGFPSLVSAAAPPLGDKARIMTAILSIALVGGLVWLATSQAEKLFAAKKPIEPAQPVARGHSIAFLPAAPPRPIFAEADLGAPFMSDEAMAFGLEELVLDSAMIEKVIPIAPVVAIAQPEAEKPSPAMQSVGAMLNRLEDALDRQKAASGGTPPRPGDMASLRAALSIAA